jgi:outer membrane protein OmpA-like peptidoglycan-associated protein/flagellar hook assembly protein FlgD
MMTYRKVLIGFLLIAIPFISVSAGGAQEEQAPTLDLPAQPRQFVSPANQDGVKDVLELPFSSVVVPAEDMVIVQYELTVYDGDGQLVFFRSERQDERRGFFGNLFGGEKPQVAIPDTLTWDGTWAVPDDRLPAGASNGDLVDDGEYTYQLTVVDDAGQFARSAPFNVTVDNTAPEIGDFADPAYTVFSPNDDGVRDEIAIPVSGTREFEWVVEIENEAGEAVWTAKYRSPDALRRDRDPAPPAEVVWDGRTGSPDEPGALAPEGAYRLVLTGRDRAGNETRGEHPASIVLSLQEADLSVTVADGPAVFSPNGDGRRDAIVLALATSEPESVRTWRLDIVNAGRVVRSASGSGAPPARWEFDGTREDGSRIADGEVRAILVARLDNGNETVSPALIITIDTQAPAAVLSATTTPQPTEPDQPFVFGAGDKEGITGTIEYEAGIPWEFSLSLGGMAVAGGALSDFFDLLGVQPQAVAGGARERVQLAWNGQAILDTGSAPDGTYELVLRGEDPAGNIGESRTLRVVKDERTPTVGLSVDGEYLSPLSSGAFATATFRTRYGAPELIEQFLFEVRNGDDRMVRSSYQRRAFDSFEWNGLSNGGTVVADGPYTGRLQVIYRNGHTATVEGIGPVIVDRTSPRVRRLSATPRRFSPDGDGEGDEVRIEQAVEPGDTWMGTLVNESGEVVSSRDWGETIESFSWDGRGSDGQVVPDGDYRYVLESTDNAGNTTREQILITVNTEPAGPPELRISLRPQPFSPDGDGREDTLSIAISVESDNEIVSWRAEILDPDGRPFKRFSGNGTPPRRITWNGLSDRGELVETAREYPLSVTVRDSAGQETTEEETIGIDILVIRDGDRLRIRVSNIMFAPNTPDLFLSDEQQLDTNLDTLRRLATILNRYPDRDIIIEGHAAHIYLEGPAQQREQDLVLIPLSRSRATEVMQALMILGVDRNRMTIEAYGGARPVVPHADRENLWRNRRVEFLLQRPGN